MNELDSLNQIVSEIKFFENQAVTSYWEIGKRLSQAKKQIPHGDWMNWVEHNLGYSQRTTNELMRVYKKFPNSRPYANLNFKKVLALTSIKDEEEREEFINNNPVEDMTVRELKKEIKEYKEQINRNNLELEDYKNSNSRLTNELEKERDKETQIIEKEVIKEVKPDDYEDIKKALKQLQKDNEDLKNKLIIESNKKKEAINQLAGEQQKEELIREINGFAWTINGFIKDVGGLIYLTEYLNEVPPSSKKLFISSAETLEQWATQLAYNIKDKE